jgi:hypothetical protein
MSEPQRAYIAHLTERAEETGMGIYTVYGHVTPCGEWVEQKFTFLDPDKSQVIRHKRDRHWQPTPELAMAQKADRIRHLAQRMLEQADKLEAAAVEKVTT